MQATQHSWPDMPTICCSPEDMADLVEYGWGGDDTKWGRLRAADGHPEPYRLKWIELGNEQRNSRFVDQVKAMEDRAASLGMARQLHYLWPDTHYIAQDLNRSELERAKALGLQDMLLMDVHTGATGGVALAEKFFANASASDGGAGVMNCETNAAHHGMSRALTEAIDLNAFLSYRSPPSTGGEALPRMKGRMGSFCMESSGHPDSDCTQGLSYFSADRMWLQPGGWVHKMFHDGWQPWTAEVALGGQALPSSECSVVGELCQHRWMDTDPGFCCRASASAAFSDDRSQVALRFVNPSNTTAAAVTVALPGGAAAGWRLVNVTQLAHGGDLADANPPHDTMRISPTLAQHGGVSFVAPPQSVSVARLAR